MPSPSCAPPSGPPCRSTELFATRRGAVGSGYGDLLAPMVCGRAIEATKYFFSIGDRENVLVLTYNHDARTYEREQYS
jgi:hypothetical protein